MNSKSTQREYFLDSIRALLMLLGVPFHLSLIYSSQHWAFNSPTSSFGLTLFNEFIHAFRMQVFFVISGYFSYMLYLKYQPKRFIKIRLQRIGIPCLTALFLITTPQFFLMKDLAHAFTGWEELSLYEKLNILSWQLISHLWFLLVLCIFTVIGLFIFRRLQQYNIRGCRLHLNWLTAVLALMVSVLIWCLFRQFMIWALPDMIATGLFNLLVMQTLQYLPYFVLGAIAWQSPNLKNKFINPNPLLWLGAALLFIAYHFNQQLSHADDWLYEIDALITMLMGVCMVNVCFSIGHKFLNYPSPFIRYLVNASLFIYLVHHPLTLIYGLYIMPEISNNLLGFLSGLVFVFGISFLLYEAHLRIPVLKFLFSGKFSTVSRSPQN